MSSLKVKGEWSFPDKPKVFITVFREIEELQELGSFIVSSLIEA